MRAFKEFNMDRPASGREMRVSQALQRQYVSDGVMLRKTDTHVQIQRRSPGLDAAGPIPTPRDLRADADALLRCGLFCLTPSPSPQPGNHNILWFEGDKFGPKFDNDFVIYFFFEGLFSLFSAWNSGYRQGPRFPK